MEIRAYRAADEAAVVALWRLALPDSAPHNDPGTIIRKKLEVRDGLFLVAIVDGELAGTAVAGYDGHRGWLYAVAVRADQRRHGIGTALVRAAERSLAARGCLKVNLQVRASNETVVAFYEALGYSVEPRISMGRRLY